MDVSRFRFCRWNGVIVALVCLALSGCAPSPQVLRSTATPTAVLPDTATPTVAATTTPMPSPTATATPQPTVPSLHNPPETIAYEYNYLPDKYGMMQRSDIMLRTTQGRIVRLTTDGHNSTPQWAPDGRHFLYVHSTPSSEQLVVVNSMGMQPRILLTLSTSLAAVAWSTTGNAIVYASLDRLETPAYAGAVHIAASAVLYPSGEQLPGAVALISCTPSTEFSYHYFVTSFDFTPANTRNNIITVELAWSPDTNVLATDAACAPLVGSNNPILFRTSFNGMARRLTPLPADAYDLNLTADGQRLFFQTGLGIPADISVSVASSDGTHIHQTGFGTMRLFSGYLNTPDGRTVYLTYEGSMVSSPFLAIGTVEANGAIVVPSSSSHLPFPGGWLSLTPDSRWLLLSSNVQRPGASTYTGVIYMLPASGQGQPQLVAITSE